MNFFGTEAKGFEMLKPALLAAFLPLLCCQGLAAVEILRETSEPNAGIPIPLSLADSEWRSKTMLCPDKPEGSGRVWSGPDFFAGEYGRPCDFSEDFLKLYGYASGPYKLENGFLEFTVGEKPFFFGFGPEPGKASAQAPLRFGFNWGGQRKDLFRLRMEIEQSLPETSWEFDEANATGSAFEGKPKSFVVKGSGLQTYEEDIGLVREATREFATGFKFVCKTPGAKIRIKSLKIAPSSAEVFFRKSFSLPDAPFRAHCSFRDSERYKLYVNGALVSSGTGVYSAPVLKSVDLTPYLKKGRNEIGFMREYLMWNVSACKPDLLFEGVAVFRDGSLERLLGDSSWRCALKAPEGWQEPSFDDSAWSSPKLSDQSVESQAFDGKRVFTGMNPKYMGLLDAAPRNRQYPIFSESEKLEFLARLPLGFKGRGTPELSVCKGGSDEELERVEGVSSPDLDGYAAWLFSPKAPEPGPYRLLWRLKSNGGEILETRREEFVRLGPVRQDSVPLADFEADFEKRLKLVAKIDCSKPAPPDSEFIDHAGMYNSPAVNKGKISEAGALRYRETGSGRFDYFAYRLHLRERGVPYLAEIVIPDDKDRYVYSGVTENYPAGFTNNVASGWTGWFTATGTCYTGVRYPLSGGVKKLRYVFFPQSFNSSVLVMSGFGGFPAAACEINIYKIEGGLPALEIPESDRLFGSHNERLSTMRLTTGMAESPFEFDKGLSTAPHRDFYFNWWNAIARKIALLRFQGYNMSVEGVYMYSEGEYPSLKHNHRVSDGSEADPVALLVKMYNANKIKILLGFEYIASPQVYIEGKAGISERSLWQGERSTRLVDRYGRQLVGYMNNGFNFLNPDIERIMLDCVSEIYGRYDGCGDVAGFFLVNGYWWLPTFNTHAYPELADIEVGYDDDSAERFEKDSGVKLGIDPKDPQRFQKRYALLSSKYLQDWLLWRAKAAKDFSVKIAARIKAGKDKWRLYQYATVGSKDGGRTPFLNPDSKRAERDSYMARRFMDFGMPLELYRDQRDATLVAPLGSWSKFSSPDENYDYVYGWNKNPGSRKIVEELGAFYVGVCNGLDEVDSPATAAKRWLFQGTARGVFTPRAAGDCAMNEFVDATMSSKIPRVIFDQWLDCNLETASGSQLRRFAKAFYATPELPFKLLAAKGVFAQRADAPDGSVYLRLVNNTPFASGGSAKLSAKSLKDLVYGRNLASGETLELKPYEVLVLRVEGLASEPEIAFSFDERTERELFDQARFVLKQDALLRKVPGDFIAQLYAGLAASDAFALWNLMDDFEVMANVRSAKALLKAQGNQKDFLSELKEKGSARIDCGSSAVYVDAKGRRWLPDQPFPGPEAYGNIGGNSVNRGAIEIADSVAPAVYRTEIYAGRLRYVLPLPPGKYDVKLHFAETFVNNAKPGMRLFSVSIGGRLFDERIDILAKAGALNTPCVFKAEGVSPSVDGLLEIELNGNPCLNGIEVERCD